MSNGRPTRDRGAPNATTYGRGDTGAPGENADTGGMEENVAARRLQNHLERLRQDIIENDLPQRIRNAMAEQSSAHNHLQYLRNLCQQRCFLYLFVGFCISVILFLVSADLLETEDAGGAEDVTGIPSVHLKVKGRYFVESVGGSHSTHLDGSFEEGAAFISIETKQAVLKGVRLANLDVTLLDDQARADRRYFQLTGLQMLDTDMVTFHGTIPGNSRVCTVFGALRLPKALSRRSYRPAAAGMSIEGGEGAPYRWLSMAAAEWKKPRSLLVGDLLRQKSLDSLRLKQLVFDRGLQSGDGRHDPLQQLDGDLASADCGFSMKILASAVDLVRSRQMMAIFAVTYGLITLAEARLYHLQNRHEENSDICKLSLVSMSAHILVDAFFAGLVFSKGLEANLLFPLIGLLTFFRGISIFILQLKMIVKVWRAQTMQEISAMRLAQEGQLESLIRQRTSAFVRNFSIVIAAALFLLGRVFLWGPWALLVCYCFLSSPQIAKDVWKGQRNSVPLVSFVGLLLSKLVMPMYLYLVPTYFSVFSDEVSSSVPFTPNSTIALLFVMINATQIVLFLLQKLLGPRCLVPLAWLPHVYDYYRPLPEKFAKLAARQKRKTQIAIYKTKTLYEQLRDVARRVFPGIVGTEEIEPKGVEMSEQYQGQIDLEAQQQEADEAEDGDVGLAADLECVICMTPVDLNNVTGSQRRVFTPCEHAYHEACLIQWMNIKMECPSCRGALPPFP